MSRLSIVLSTLMSSIIILGCTPSTPNSPSISAETNQTKSADNASETTAVQRVQEVYWKLIGVEGKAVMEDPNGREAYIILKLEDNRLQGFGGCNILLGSYELNESDHTVHFLRVASTMMACSRIADESEFLKALEKVDHYKIDEGVLLLQKADKTVATFEASYQP
ncbi:META domain-containing protein [Sulfurospirillum diekertiae]|uniref:META domain-containing protein n=1 Tax=Sulfurospirillum diekertiae TaxID=1854492 RepID=A0AA92FIN4_9BACT|nr:META domain-containing protein [Sulfurospirillum diekertiae]QIR76956.1 META domain-containing protein [Sulfurospirillum diekertiae]